MRVICLPFKLQCLYNYDKKLFSQRNSAAKLDQQKKIGQDSRTEKRDFWINMFNKVNLIVFFNKNDKWSNLARRDCKKIKEYELHWQLEVL